MNLKLLLILLITLSGCNHHHKHHHKKGEMNKKFLGPNVDVDKWKKGFENKNRDVYKNRNQIIESLDIQKDDVVADIGAGTGAFLKGLNDKVGPKGKVYAVEISEKFVEYMQLRAKQEKLSSVEVVKGEFHTTTLPTNSLDYALLIDVYHHLDEPTDMLNDFKRILKKNGILAIVDFDKIPGVSRQWVINHMRLDKKGYIEEISKAGFKFVSESKIPFKENFMLIFRK